MPRRSDPPEQMDEAPSAKRARLSLACNECRRRKVKCDSDYPKCHHCRSRNVDCVTTDPKHPGLAVVREWIEPVDKNAQPFNKDKTSTAMSPTAVSANALSQETEDLGVSPIQVPYDMFFSKDQARIKMMGSSSSACLTQSLNLYLNRAGVKAVSDHFKHGMRHAEEYTIPLRVFTPALPPEETRCRYVVTYFQRIHTLFPIFNIDETKEEINQLASIKDLKTIAFERMPLLVSAYLILSLGADEEASERTKDGDLYLEAAASLMGNILLMPYLSTVQAMLLLTITYRGRNKDGLAWQTIGMAVRVAQTLGLHRHSVLRPSQHHIVTKKMEQLFHARIWAVCCCLEKGMQIESGRPSAIGPVDRDQMMGQEQRAPGMDYLQWNMKLAGFQNDISDHIYGHRPGDRTPSQILQHTARLDKSLSDWCNELPPDYRPTNDLVCPDTDFHFAVYLSIQYHQSMIALHRAGLLAPTAAFEKEIDKHYPEESFSYRLKAGETICVKSARSIARLVVEVADRKTESRVVTVSPAMLACVVLAIHLAKRPVGRMQAADLELLKACAEHVQAQYLKSGQDERYARVPLVIYESIQHYLHALQIANSTTGHAHASSIQPLQPSNNGTRLTAPSSTPLIGASSAQPNRSNRDRSPRNIRQTAPPATQLIQTTSTTSQNNAMSSDSSGAPSNSLIAQNMPQEIDPSQQNNVNAATDRIERPLDPQDDLTNASSPIFDPAFFNNLSTNLEIGPAPFDDYNVEELWNWMLLMDANGPSPQDGILRL